MEEAMSELSRMECVPCKGTEPALTPTEIEQFRPSVPDWELIYEGEQPRLRRVFRFKNFAQALAFTNRVGEIAEQQDHHPALLTEWGRVTVSWWTHAIHGLHQNDFIMAAKTDRLYEA